MNATTASPTPAILRILEDVELTSTERLLHLTLAALLPKDGNIVTINTRGLERLTARHSPVIYRSIKALEDAGLWQRLPREKQHEFNRYRALFLTEG